jgi:hypothetical protein
MSAPDQEADPQAEEWGRELLLQGQEHMLRGADTGVLVAFAAMAFQELRGGEKQPHHDIAFELLLLSVLFCAVIHFALGNAYVWRSKKLMRRKKGENSNSIGQRIFAVLAWLAGVLQLLCILAGLVLLFLPSAPAFLRGLQAGP